MESCHSYIHDFLKQRGPTYAMDPNLQQEINNFPPEAKVGIDYYISKIFTNIRVG